MTREEKTAAIAELKETFGEYSFFYLTDSSTLTVELVNKLRRKCYEEGIKMEVVKNTLAVKALSDADDSKNYSELTPAFNGPTALLFSTNPNAPARLIEKFRKENDTERPILKAAYIDTAVFLGDEQLKTLTKLKSKDELIGEIIGLLQSPMANVVGALQSGGTTIGGILKTLEERNNG